MTSDLVPPRRYTPIEDAQGLVVSTLLCAFGIHLLRAAGLVTGGTAGLALLLSYLLPVDFGALFFVVNLPFYAVAWRLRGAAFALKSLASVTAVSLLAEALPPLVGFGHLAPAAAAVLFGALAGVGLLGLFRHGASLGGVSLVAVIMQDRFGLRAGWVLLGWDVALFALSLAVLAPAPVLWSALGALLLNSVIAMNHRRDWYVVS